MHKKKQRTPEQIKNRFYFAIGLIAVMAAVVFLTPKHEVDTTESDSITAAMDRTIDSLAVDMYGPGAEVIMVKPFEKMESMNQTAEELERAREKLELMASMSSGKDTANLAAARKAVEELKAKRDTVGTDDDFYARRVRIKTKEGRVFTGFQRINTGLRLSDLTFMSEIIGDKDKQQKEIEQTVKEIEQ